nr:adhesive plaque matrix protein-like [Maniola hyperantus]
MTGTPLPDCFDRISIGEQLPHDAIYRNVTELTTIECEQICKQDKQCQAYDYGVGAKGNATCDLSNMSEKQIKDKNLFIRNPDYDVYVRRFQCEQSPPLPMGQQNGPVSENQHRPIIRPGEEDPNRPMYDDLNPYETNRPSYITNSPNRPSYGGDERPDEYNTGSPENVRPPSYGAHKPQEIPFRPNERPPSYGSHRPQEIPYRPDERPPSYGAHKPQEIPYRPDERPPSYGAHKPQEIPYNPEQRPPSYGVHRPQEIPFRPDNDRPPSYGAHKPQEIPYRPEDRPPSYGSHRPQEIPYRPEDRPPSYGIHKPQEIPYRPDNDRPPSYGLHKPQEIPYRPEDRPPSYGVHRPQDIPYRPVRPSSNNSRPSDSYDQLYFQDPYGKPRPEYWRPDPYHPPLPGDEIEDIYGPKPIRPQYAPERPQYQYIIRPNKRPPRPLSEEQGYHQVKPLYPSRPEYGTGLNDPDRPYKPTRPYVKPSYTYTGQYASNYGTSQDNSIKVEIYDPPRPYRPSVSQRPYQDSLSNGEMYGQGYGYNSYSDQQSFSQSASHYGSWNENYQGYKPQKPSSGGYGDNENDDMGYGPKPQKPSQPSGSYGQNDQTGYNQGVNSSGYGQTSSNMVMEDNLVQIVKDMEVVPIAKDMGKVVMEANLLQILKVTVKVVMEGKLVQLVKVMEVDLVQIVKDMAKIVNPVQVMQDMAKIAMAVKAPTEVRQVNKAISMEVHKALTVIKFLIPQVMETKLVVVQLINMVVNKVLTMKVVTETKPQTLIETNNLINTDLTLKKIIIIK